MPSNYPDALDSLSNPASGDPLVLPSHASQHANANDAIEAIQAAIGINPPRITKSGTEPDSPSQGDIWVDISSGITKMHSGTEWIGIAYSPENAEPGQVLRVNADKDGYEFASAGLWRPIDKLTVPIGSPVAEMGFSNLAATPYAHYRVHGYIRRANLGDADRAAFITINGDTTTGNYDYDRYNNGAYASSNNAAQFQITDVSDLSGNDSNAIDFTAQFMRRKYVMMRLFGSTGDENGNFFMAGGSWNNTVDPIDEIAIFLQTSPADMYGELELEGRME